jgi:SP family general alpha glucoside:H+ symporter-like MFS transporter
MSLIQGIKLYPKAIMWSIIISTCIAMEGYDVALINNFYAFESFKRKFGVEIAPGEFEVSPSRSIGNLELPLFGNPGDLETLHNVCMVC